MSDYDKIKDIEYDFTIGNYVSNEKLEMINHLNNILKSLNSIIIDENINDIRNNIELLMGQIKNNDKINLEIVKNTSNEIYSLNLQNQFSEETDYISNEYYAFEYILQELLKKGGK